MEQSILGFVVLAVHQRFSCIPYSHVNTQSDNYARLNVNLKQPLKLPPMTFDLSRPNPSSRMPSFNAVTEEAAVWRPRPVNSLLPASSQTPEMGYLIGRTFICTRRNRTHLDGGTLTPLSSAAAAAVAAMARYPRTLMPLQVGLLFQEKRK